MNTIKLSADAVRYAAEAAYIDIEAVTADVRSIMNGTEVEGPSWGFQVTADELMSFTAALADYLDRVRGPGADGYGDAVNRIVELGQHVVRGSINFGSGRMTLAFQQCELVGEL